MKIIKKGENREPWVGRRVTCDCGTIFELEERDSEKIRFGKGSQFDPGDWVEVNCPICQKECFANL